MENTFFINKLSIELNDNNFSIISDLENNEIITFWDWYCNTEDNKINIILDDKISFKKLNNALKSYNINYEVVSIFGVKEEIKEEFHHLIEG